MRLASTRTVKPNKTIAKTIYNETGSVLVRQGVVVTEQLKESLLKRGITCIYIEEDSTKDIYVNLSIPSDLRIEATKTIREVFSEMKMEQNFIFNKREEKLTKMIRNLIENMSVQKDGLSLLADILVTDDYLFQHSLNVALYALAIGSQLGFSEKELIELGLGSILHDFGKIFIDDTILKKEAHLTTEEYEEMKQHPELGFDFIRQHTDLPTVVAHCAYQHHERLDGSGYPRKLVGNEIHTYAKVIGVADVFDAVTTNRVYRKAMLPHEGLEILYAQATDKFDIKIVEAFKKSIVIYPNGITVELSDGRKGVVVRQNQHLYDRPIIRIMDVDDTGNSEYYDLDLSKALNIMITSCYIV